MTRKPWENKSGANDPTAYAALQAVSAEEQKVSDFIKAVKILAGLCGLEIESWISIRVKKSGRGY